MSGMRQFWSEFCQLFAMWVCEQWVAMMFGASLGGALMCLAFMAREYFR